MAATVVQKSAAATTEASSTGSTTITSSAFAGNVAAGNGLVVVVRGFNGSLPTVTNVRSNKDGTTNFSVAVAIAADATGDFIMCYYLPNTAGGSGLTTTATFSGTVSNLYSIAYECGGVPTDASFFQTGLSQTSGNSAATPSQTGGANTEIAFIFFSSNQGASTTISTDGSGWSRGGQITDGTSGVFGSQDWKTSATFHSASVSGSWTCGGGAASSRAAVALFNATTAAVHVQTKDAQVASGTSINISLSNVGAGNHLVVTTIVGGPTVTTGNVTVPTSSPSATWANAVPAFVPGIDFGMRCDYSENVASGSWTVTCHSSVAKELTGLVSESSGVATTASIGATNTGTAATGGTTIATGSITPTAGSILYTGVGDNGGTTTAGTIDNSFVVSSDATAWNGANQRGGHAHKDNVAASAVNPTWTVPSTTMRAAFIVEFLAAVTSGGGYVPPPVFPGVFNLDARRMI
jgi:hypothetical protein